MIALIRNDGEPALLLEGTLSFDHVKPGRVTSHRNLPGRFIVSGKQTDPKTINMTAAISPYPLGAGLLQGDARIAEVDNFLEYCWLNGTLMSLQEEGEPTYENYAIETLVFMRDDTDVKRLQISFKQVKFAQTRTVELIQTTAASKKKGGKPTAVVKDGLATKTEKGTRLTSVLVEGFDSLVGLADLN